MNKFEVITKDEKSLAYFLSDLLSNGNTSIEVFRMRSWTTKKWLDYLKEEVKNET